MDPNNKEPSQDKIKEIDSIIRDLGTTIKNSVLYTPEHSICIYSIKNFLTSLGKWMAEHDSIILGVSPDSIFLDGISTDQQDKRHNDTASYLHVRGIVSLTILKGISAEELTEFFSFIRKDAKAIRSEGGVGKNLSKMQHLKIKEIDYSQLLKKTEAGAVTEEDEVWGFLFDIKNQIGKGEKLPTSKVDFLVDFLKDTKKAAKTLNKVYKNAREELQDEKVTEETKEAIVKICEYFEGEEFADGQTQEVKVKLMDIISQLHPDLITNLFEQTSVDGETFDLAEKITKDFPDSFIAEFIETLITDEDTFNENLLKVFDKLAPDAPKSSSVVSMVADKLFNKRILNPDTLSKLQMSIKEIFTEHPDSSFMSEMYKITVDAVTNKKIDTLIYVARLTPLINKFVQSLKEDKLKKEEVWLLLNILWLENNAFEFEKFGGKLIDVLPELLDSKDVGRIREILEFFTENVRKEQQDEERMAQAIKGMINNIATKENLDDLINLIPEAKSTEIEDITDIFIKTKERASTNPAPALIDAYLKEKTPAYRNKFRHIFSNMKEEVAQEVMDRLEYCEPFMVRDLLGLLREYAPEKANLVSKKLISHKNAQVRWEGLDSFDPRTEEDRSAILEIYKNEKDREVQKKAASALLRTKDKEVIDTIFSCTEKGFFLRRFLINLVELCGYLRIEESFPHLERIFLKKSFFNTKWRDDLRIAAVTSLKRLNTEDAIELVKKGLSDKRKRVRKMCEIIIKLGNKQIKTEEDDGREHKE